ncbi:MAG: flagellar filament capping protein FliD [Proteobacteria bacterium]|nr:flagellar filament capping protein FliD [Burkholderiales bacterium]
MAISSPGVGSNLDVNSIVSQLMALERRPLNVLDTREVSYQARLSAFGTIRGALSQFQGSMNALAVASRFQGVTTSSTDATTVSASAASSAAAGSYSIEVSALAQSQRLVAAGQASNTATVGTGTLTFDFGTISGGTFDSTSGTYTGSAFTSSGSAVRTVTIAPESSSLAGIRDAINAAGVGVTASLINDGSASPYRLVLSVDKPGAANALKIGVSGDAALQSLLTQDPAATQNLAQSTSAQDARLKINGVDVTKASNVISDALDGVTLTLTKTNVATPVTISVARDTSSTQSAADSFVKSYNELYRTLSDLSAYNAQTRSGAVLNGDAAVRTLQNELRAVFNQPLTGTTPGLRSISDIGIAFQRDGTLALDSIKLSRALTANPGGIAGLFAPLGSSTDSLVQFVKAGTAVTAGSYALNVTQLATRGASVGAGAAALTITAGVNDTLDLLIDDTAISVTLAAGTYASAAALAAELQGRINGNASALGAARSARVSESSGVLSVTSDAFGSTSKAELAGGSALASLFGGVPTRTDGVDVAGTLGAATAVGSGQTLTSDSGLSVRVLGGALGDRAAVGYTIGFAAQLSSFAGAQLGTTGAVAGRTDGINRSIAGISDQRTSLGRRLDDVEKRYRAQFAALDVLISNLSQTSSFLTQQLSALNSTSRS